jgi:hypothetical protein
MLTPVSYLDGFLVSRSCRVSRHNHRAGIRSLSQSLSPNGPFTDASVTGGYRIAGAVLLSGGQGAVKMDRTAGVWEAKVPLQQCAIDGLWITQDRLLNVSDRDVYFHQMDML